jgi:alpha-glucosidase
VGAARGRDRVHGEVWPGECVFPDFTNAKVREWWAGLYADFMANGIDGVWNDMNEPSVFNVESKTMPEDNHHRADAELGGPAPHARYHNVYGMLMVEASREGIMSGEPREATVRAEPGELHGGAPLRGDLDRGQHLELATCRDVDPDDAESVVVGAALSGPDLGGFIHDGDGEMYARWFGFGSLLPFARGHTQKGTSTRSPGRSAPRLRQRSAGRSSDATG